MSTKWWGNHTIRPGETRHWQLGACHFQVHRREREWLVEKWESKDGAEEMCSVSEEASDPADKSAYRCISSQDAHEIVVLPVAADRSVVARPEIALEISSASTLTLYVGSPLWVRIVEAATGDKLLEVPAQRPTDTWFGSTPIVGTLAYATRTTARLSLENLPTLPTRLLTRVLVKNQTKSALHIERILLPAPNLSVYVDEEGRFWSEDVSMDVAELASEADVELIHDSSEESKKRVLVTECRHQTGTNILVRAMTALRI